MDRGAADRSEPISAVQAVQDHQPGAFGRAVIGAAVYGLLTLALLPTRNGLGGRRRYARRPHRTAHRLAEHPGVLTAVLTPPLFAAGTVMGLLVLRRTRLDRQHPFGPHMLTGALLAS